MNQAGVGPLGPIRVYGNSELHFTNVKALRTLGLGAEFRVAFQSTTSSASASPTSSRRSSGTAAASVRRS